MLAHTDDITASNARPSGIFADRLYPPLVLIMANNFSRARKLKKYLEDNGCQVDWLAASRQGLVTVRKKYFDLIVFDLERVTLADLRLCKRLKTEPDLATYPLVVLTPCAWVKGFIDRFKWGSVYYLSKNNAASAELLPLIQQIHYLTYRYG